MAVPDGIIVTPKAPTDVAEYVVTYKGLVTDTIASIGVAGSGITVNSSSFTATTVTVWVSGGTLGTYGTVTITVTTAAARVFARVLVIEVKTL